MSHLTRLEILPTLYWRFDDFDSYVGNSPKHGASVGPVAGRIAGATFELNGKTYDLEVNNASNCNHSGSTGWDSSLFELVEVSDHGLTLYTERTDGTGGFPGNLKIWISYHLEETGAYEISYKVTTDQDTLVNPTNHSYFNLSGDFTQTIDRHVFQLNTEGIYPIAPDGVPAKTPDANRDVVKHIYNGALLKDIFAEEDEQIQLVSGLDHPFALLQVMTMLDSFMTKIQVASCSSRQRLLALWSTQQTLWMRVSS